MTLDILDSIEQGERQCYHCHQPLVRKERESKHDWDKRKFCNHKCAGPHRGQKPRVRCKEGHLLAETAYISPSGRRYCGVCQSTRVKHRRATGPDPNVATQRCYRCNRDLPCNQFYPDRTKTTRLNNECKRCARDRQLSRDYGITVDEYENMVISQKGVCAICDRARALHVDHCHQTGRVRGLLCSQCNHAIGLLHDDMEIMSRAMEYLDGT